MIAQAGATLITRGTIPVYTQCAHLSLLENTFSF